jgi:septal ring factor EnvC (AmiA/AmiB activator)
MWFHPVLKMMSASVYIWTGIKGSTLACDYVNHHHYLPWPANGIVLSRFGRQPVRGGLVVTRNGVEISLAEGRPVAAVHEGVVSFAAPFTGYANLVILDHGNGAQTVYGHLASVTVSKGGAVAAGTNVGLSGRNPAGNPALYFELRVDGKPVDPLQWLRKPL